MGGVRHVDGDHDVVAEAFDQRRGIGPAPADIPQAMQPAALDRHEADLLRRTRGRDVVDGEPRRPGLLAGLAGMGLDVRGLGAVVVPLVGEIGLRPHVLGMDDQQQVLMGLQMQVPGVGRCGKILAGLGFPRIADIDHAEAVGEEMPDIGETALDHDLHGIGPAALVAMADQLHVLRVLRRRQRGVTHRWLSSGARDDRFGVMSVKNSFGLRARSSPEALGVGAVTCPRSCDRPSHSRWPDRRCRPARGRWSHWPW